MKLSPTHIMRNWNYIWAQALVHTKCSMLAFYQLHNLHKANKCGKCEHGMGISNFILILVSTKLQLLWGQNVSSSKSALRKKKNSQEQISRVFEGHSVKTVILSLCFHLGASSPTINCEIYYWLFSWPLPCLNIFDLP